MTAGKGIVHAEMPVGEQTNTGLQLWINLPKKAKMMAPRYQECKGAQIPTASSPDHKVSVKVIAGESYGVQANIETMTPIYYLDVKMEPGASYTQTIPENYTTFCYSLTGKAKFGDKVVDAHTAMVWSQQGTQLLVTTLDEPVRFVVIAGQPINEPIVQHGPFVMNTVEEIREAIMDYQFARNGFEKAGWSSEIGQR